MSLDQQRMSLLIYLVNCKKYIFICKLLSNQYKLNKISTVFQVNFKNSAFCGA